MTNREIMNILFQIEEKISSAQDDIKEIKSKLATMNDSIEEISVDMHFLISGQQTLQNTVDQLVTYRLADLPDME